MLPTLRRRIGVLRGHLRWSFAAHLALAPLGMSRRRPPRGGPRHADGQVRPPVRFVLLNAYGMGGTVRTVLNLADHLADRGWDVEVLSVLRHRPEPFFPVHERVRLVPLDDCPGIGDRAPARPGWRGRLDARLSRLPSVLCPPEEAAGRSLTLLNDVQLVRALRGAPPCVLVATRPYLCLIAARFAPSHVRTVGQEHMNFSVKRGVLLAEMRRYYRRLDVLAVLTRGDERDYRRLLGDAPTQVVRIPNAVPPIGEYSADPRAKVAVGVGRLTRQKGFDLLLRAWVPVVEQHPDWQLRIFGDGPERKALAAQIEQLGLRDSAHLMGRSSRIGEELARASVFALSSRAEGFPLVLVEAMEVGLATAAFACPRGPADLLEHGVTGLLVPPRNVRTLTRALLTLIEDPELRATYGKAARIAARAYHRDEIGPQWERLLTDLAAGPGPGAPPTTEIAAGGRRVTADRDGRTWAGNKPLAPPTRRVTMNASRSARPRDATPLEASSSQLQQPAPAGHRPPAPQPVCGGTTSSR